MTGNRSTSVQLVQKLACAIAPASRASRGLQSIAKPVQRKSIRRLIDFEVTAEPMFLNVLEMTSGIDIPRLRCRGRFGER